MSDDGVLPSGWAHMRLEDLGMMSTTTVDPSKEPDKEWELWSVPSFPTGCPEVLTGAKIGSSKQRVYEGDVLLCKINPRINRVWVVSEAHGLEQIASSEWIIFRKTEVEPRFLMHRLRESKFREELCAEVSGVGGSLTRARPQTVKALRISLPPVAEQRRIVTKIEALQERSRRAREALAEVGPLLEQFRQSVLAAAFRGDLTADWRAAHPDVESASELLYRIRTERRRWEQAELAKYEAKGRTPPKNWQDKYEEPEPVDDSVLPELLNGWEWVRVKDIGEVQLGRQRAPQYHSGPNMRPYLRVMNVFEDRIDTEDIMKMDFSPEEFERYRLEPEDILLNEGQSRELVGRSAIYHGEIPSACFTNTLVRFRPDTPIESDYPQIVFLAWMFHKQKRCTF